MSHNNFDAIVIGAGIAGLSTAAYLARAGKKVAVFEQHSRPGGYWTSWVRQGMIFDVSPHWTIAPDAVNRLLADHGVAPLKFEQHSHVARCLGPEPGWDLWISGDRRRFEASVIRSFPSVDRGSLARFLDLCRDVFREIESAPSLNLELMNPVARLAASAPMLLKLSRVIRYAKMPGTALLDAFFPGEELRGLRTLLYLTAPIPDISAIGVIAMAGTALLGRAHSPVGGAQVVGDAFAAAAQCSGAEIRYSQQVRRILVRDGRAAGVELEDGSQFQARTIVAAMDARQTYSRLLDPALAPPDFRKKLDAYPLPVPYVMVSLVTDLDPAACGFEDTDTWVADSVDLNQCLAPNEPEKSAYQLVFPRYRTADADPCHYAVQIVAPATFGHENYWQAGPDLKRGEDYRRFKREYAARLIKRAESRIPGLSEHIVALDVATPLTMYRYTLNDQASPIGWGYNNPLRWAQRVPFVPGLYQAGHWVGPSGVVNAGNSGKHAAELVLRDIGA